MSEVTIEFLVLRLVKLNYLFCDSHLARGDYHMLLEIVLQKEVSEGNPVSYRYHPFDGRFLINGRIVFQNGHYIFKLNKSSKNSSDRDCNHRNDPRFRRFEQWPRRI